MTIKTLKISALARLKSVAKADPQAELLKAALAISKKFGKPDEDRYTDFGRKCALGRNDYTWLSGMAGDRATIGLSIDERNYPGKIKLFSKLMWPTYIAAAPTAEKLLQILATRATKNLAREEKMYNERLPKAINEKAKKDIKNEYEFMAKWLKNAASI